MWNRIWYRPISSHRVELLTRLVYFVLAFDAWLLMLPRAALYGSSGFNVAHFRWLDAIQPDPSPTLYVFVLALVGGLSLAAALGRPNRGVTATIAVLYTYGWSMSLLDAYQHHYFLSLVLLCFACCPPQEDACKTTEGGRGSEQRDRAGSARVAWGFQLLGAIVAIMYGYAAVAKLDAGWLSGRSAEVWLGKSPIATWIGAGRPISWSQFGVAVAAAEFLLSLAYATVVACGESRSRAGQAWRAACLVLAIGLHAGIAFADLRIGWFTAYMMLLAGAFFLPSTVLASANIFLSGSIRRVRLPVGGGVNRRAAIAAGVGGLALAVALRTSSLPGSGWAVGVLTVFVFVLAGAAAIWRRDELSRWAERLTLASWAMALTLFFSPTHFEFYLWQAKDLQARGEHEKAVEVLEVSVSWNQRVRRRRRAEREQILGACLLRLKRTAEAVDHLRRAIELNPGSATAHFYLGNAARAAGMKAEAVGAYEASIELRRGFVAAHANLGILLSETGELDRGVASLRRATKLDPGCVAAHRQLGMIWLQRQQFEMARAALDSVLQRQADDPQSHYLLGTLHDLQGDLPQAMHHYRTAVRFSPTHVQARYNLGTVYARQGNPAAAAREFEGILSGSPATVSIVSMTAARRRRWNRRPIPASWRSRSAHNLI